VVSVKILLQTPKMSTKRKLSLSSPQPAKKERKAIDLATKMQVIKQYEGGKKVNAMARDLKLSQTTVERRKKRTRRSQKGNSPLRNYQKVYLY